MADKFVGGSDAVLVINRAPPKKRQLGWCHSSSKMASAVGKNANCHTLVSLTLARGQFLGGVLRKNSSSATEASS